MANTSSSSSGGIGFTSLLIVLFIGLKLAHVISWSWWWVSAPLWMSALLVLSILGLLAIIAVAAALIK